MEILLFILVSIGVIIVPGPNVLVIVSTCISHGRLRGLQTVAGTSTAMIVQLFIAAIGTSWFVSTLASGFFWLKWTGVLYLCYLGVNHLKSAVQKTEHQQISGIGSFHRGFWVSLTNPKTILFFSAFLPQFVYPSESYFSQIALLSSIFCFLAVVLDSSYALLADKLTSLLGSKFSAKQNYLSSALYLGASATLAATKHGQ